MFNKTLLGCGLLLATSVAAAAEADLVISTTSAVGATQLDMDILNDAGVSALQFELAIPSGNVDTSKCLSALPSTHTGACTFKDGVLRVAVFSAGNDDLPSGALGNISVNGAVAQDQLKVSGLLMGTSDAAEVSSNAIIHRENEMLDRGLRETGRELKNHR